MGKKVSHLVVALCFMLSLILPSGLIVQAASDPSNLIFDLSEGNITITSAGAGNLQVNYGNLQTTTFDSAQVITITQSDTTSATANSIKVDGVHLTIHLMGVNSEPSSGNAFQLINGANVTLKLVGVNTLTGASNYAGLGVSTGNTINIQGTGILIAKGGQLGSGIGGGERESSGTITISETATVTATGGHYGAGIGGGFGGSNGTITIGDRARVIVTGGIYGAGGGGYLGASDTITIKGTSSVIATGGNGSSGIGGGLDGDGGTITISETATVTATGGAEGGSGIGGGFNRSGGTIAIEGTATVIVTGGEGGSGIGGGAYGSGGTITISEAATVTTTGGIVGSGIGGGAEGSGGTITIEGTSTVTASGGYLGSGIGGGRDGDGGTITIDGTATVTAIGGENGSGIGGGHSGVGGNISINRDAKVIAHSNGKSAIDTIANNLTPGSTATVLMANFTELQVGNTVSGVYVKGETLSYASTTPSLDYQSIAFTVPNTGSYRLNTGGKWQYVSGNLNADLIIDTTGLALFNNIGVIPTYKVTFVDDDGITEIASQIVNHGDAASPSDPIKTGYTFLNWDKDFSKITGPLTVKANYKVNPYTLTFDSDGGSVVAPITQDYGTTVKAPDAPTRPGYTFVGWNPALPSTMPSEDFTLKAKWTVNAYTITFDSDGGSVVAPITQDYGTTVKAPDAPTKLGYTFAGWDQEIPATMPSQDLTLNAKWTVNAYTITFDSDGGSVVAPITQDYGTTVKVPDVPTKPGNTFAGWNPALPSTMPSENLTLRAKWTVNAYTITFDSDGGSVVAPITQEYGTTLLAPEAPTKPGYTFAGWNPALPSTMPSEDHTLTAQWTQVSSGGDSSNGGTSGGEDTPAPVNNNKTFNDVRATDWYYEAVIFAIERGLFYGTTSETFSPNESMTRGMLVTVLHRLENNSTKDSLPFSDVQSDAYYADAIAWAASQNIVNGYVNGLFGPNNPITREQLVTILYRYAKIQNFEIGAQTNLDQFTDGANTSEYAKEAMAWAVSKGLLLGKGNKTLDPTGKASRAEVAQILMKFIKNVVN